VIKSFEKGDGDFDGSGGGSHVWDEWDGY
jgi:hypothetical protein